MELIYRISRDGALSRDFHDRCDGVKDTFTFIKSEGYNRVFGGYTSIPWTYLFGDKKDEKAYIYSISDQKIFPIETPDKALYMTGNTLTNFGCDIIIASLCDENKDSYSWFGTAYKLPDGFERNTD